MQGQAEVAGEDVPFRYHPRVGGALSVRLMLGEASRTARVLDVSMGGLRLAGVYGPLPRRFLVSIPLPTGELVTEALVVRREADGVALKLENLSWESFFELARYVCQRL